MNARSVFVFCLMSLWKLGDAYSTSHGESIVPTAAVRIAENISFTPKDVNESVILSKIVDAVEPRGKDHSVVLMTTSLVLTNNEEITEVINKESNSFKYFSKKVVKNAKPSHLYFVYFLASICVCTVVYVTYHNKQKILGLIVEGRPQSRNSSNGQKRIHYRKIMNDV